MILVTGGSGLLGKELITQLLAQGRKVTAIYNKTLLPDFNSPLYTIPMQYFRCGWFGRTDATGY